jgi:AbrB family looped-hinge helix DNA binding protein
MILSAKITSKGQITLPKEVRRLLNVQSKIRDRHYLFGN